MTKAILLAALAASALLMSGCSSADDATTTVITGEDGSTTTTTIEPTDGAPTSGAPGGGNETKESKPQELSCTATVGLVGNAQLTAGGQGLGGCTFGPSSSDSVLQEANLPAGCAPYYTSDNEQVSTGAQPAAVGTEYEAGTDFSMFCDATMLPNSTGTIVLVKA